MLEATKFSRSFWLPLTAGLAWILSGEANGFLALAFSLPPAFICFAAAYLGMTALEGERSATLAALGGAIGVVFGVFALLFFGLALGVALIALSGWTFVDAGDKLARTFEPLEEVPEIEPGTSFSAQVALDEALLGAISLMAPVPSPDDVVRIEREVAEATQLFEAKGWLEKPEDYHRIPLALELPRIEKASVRTLAGRVEFESLSFDSEYEPLVDEPGRDRWQSYAPNRTAHAHVLRHPGSPRPWIICIHGYQMGKPVEDFAAFDPRIIHEKFGFNMLLPTLPLHGPRKVGRFSGDGYLSGDMLDSIHAASQGIWDIRRLISWMRAQGAPSIGVYGLSLGGFNTALLAGLEPGLAFAIAGVPMTDLSATFWRHLPDSIIRQFLEVGLTRERLDRVAKVVSPLGLTPKVPFEGRAIFGGVGDRLVSPRQVRDLARHWDHPATEWYQGSHLTFFFKDDVQRLIGSTLEGATASGQAPS
jgi:hypothetical protein